MLAMNPNNLKIIIILFYFTSCGIALNNAITWNMFIAAGWLINYSDYFSRRGITGQLILYLNELVNIPLNILAWLFYCFFLYPCFFVIYRLITSKNYHALIYFAIFSPLAVGYFINDNDWPGRTDIVYLSFLMLYVYYIKYCNIKILGLVFFIIYYFIALLIHELIVFYLIFPLVISLYIGSIKLRNMAIVGFIFSTFLGCILILLYGQGDGDIICQSLMDRGADSIICDGIIKNSGNITDNIAYTLAELQQRYMHYSLHIIGIIFSLYPLYLWYKSLQKDDKKKLSYILVLSLCNIFPLFVLATDWGRWIFLWSISLLFIFFLFHYVKIEENSDIYSRNSVFKYVMAFINNSERRLIISLILYSCVLYRIPITKPGIRIGGFIPDFIYDDIFLKLIVSSYIN